MIWERDRRGRNDSLARRRGEHRLNLCIQFSGDVESRCVLVRSEKARHSVVREMNTVRTLVDQNCYRSVRAGVRHMLSHLSHNKWIANDKADHSRCSATCSAAHDRAVIEFHKQHQSCSPEAFFDCVLEFGIGLRLMSRFPKFSHVRVTDRGIESRNHLIKRFGGAQGESLYFDFPYHLTSPSVENSHQTWADHSLIVL